MDGPICESTDRLGIARLPPLARDDLVALGVVGAYGSSMSTTYNGRPRPPEIGWDGAELRMLRRAAGCRTALTPDGAGHLDAASWVACRPLGGHRDVGSGNGRSEIDRLRCHPDRPPVRSHSGALDTGRRRAHQAHAEADRTARQVATLTLPCTLWSMSPSPGDGTSTGTPTLSRARRAFTERLAARPLLLDGAMGTLLWSRGVPQLASLFELVETHPDIIGSVHREYVQAGADAIETDSFGANRLRLAPFGLADRTERINRRAAQLAREARDVSGRDVLIAGSVGPVAGPIHGPERPARWPIRAAFREQIEGLLEGGVDLLLFETASDLDELMVAIEEARAMSDLPVLASMTFGEELVAMDGTTPASAAARWPRPASTSSASTAAWAPRSASMRSCRWPRTTAAPLLIMPNAGLPSRVEGQFVYAAGPSYFADAVPRFLSAGATVIGGCCGTTPAHVARCARRSTRRLPARAGPPPPQRCRAAAGCRHAARDTGRASAAGSGRGGAAAHPARAQAHRRPFRDQRGDRSAALGAHRADHRGGTPPAGSRRRPRQHQRQRHGPSADGRDGGGLRHPARPGPGVPGPLHDPRPQPDGDRVRAARRPRAGRSQHPGADR